MRTITRFIGSMSSFIIACTSCDAFSITIEAQTELNSAGFPEVGSVVEIQHEKTFAWMEASVVDTQIVLADAYGQSRTKPIARKGALLYAVNAEGRGAVYCGHSGADHKAGLGTVGDYACMEDADGDGAFDFHFMKYQAYSRLPFMVSKLFDPDPLVSPVPYLPAGDEDTLRWRREIHATWNVSTGPNEFLKIDSDAPSIGLTVTDQVNGEAPYSYGGAPFLGSSDPPHFRPHLSTGGACLALISPLEDFYWDKETGPKTIRFRVDRAPSPGGGYQACKALQSDAEK